MTLKGHSEYIWRIKFSPNSEFFYSISDDKTVNIWQIIIKEELKNIS